MFFLNPFNGLQFLICKWQLIFSCFFYSPSSCISSFLWHGRRRLVTYSHCLVMNEYWYTLRDLHSLLNLRNTRFSIWNKESANTRKLRREISSPRRESNPLGRVWMLQPLSYRRPYGEQSRNLIVTIVYFKYFQVHNTHSFRKSPVLQSVFSRHISLAFCVILFFTFLSVLRLFCLDSLLCLIFELVHEIGVSDSASSLAKFVASVASSLKALGLENKRQISHFVN